MSDNFYILSIDGGGFRGAYSAYILSQIEEGLGIDWREQFQMFAGTSTGAILAAGLACQVPASELLDFYKKYGKKIFTPRWQSRLDVFKLVTSRYSSKELKKQLDSVLQEKTLGDVTVPLILPSVDIGNGCVHVFKSKYSDGFIRDPKIKVSDAVLASCSAPTYFNPHIVEDKIQLADGGLWANNPSLVAAIDANYRLKVPLENIRILSVGTGKSNTFYPKKNTLFKDIFIRSWQGWGFATKWQTSKLLDLILNLQSDTSHNMLSLLLGESPRENKRICRINFESDGCLPMDSPRKLDDWISKADHDFSHNYEGIKEFLGIKKG